MACRLYGKLIFTLWAFTVDATTRHRPIPGTALDFFVPQGCSSGNGEAMAKQWRSNEEAMRRLVRIFWGGVLIQWGNQGDSE